jgi:hypothetical protein
MRGAARPWLVAVLLALTACSAPPPPPAAGTAADSLPPMRRFGPAQPDPPARANADMVRDFLDLGFQMESGRPVPRLSRFDGPVSVAVQPGSPAVVKQELDLLIARLRREAGIDIRRIEAGRPAAITVLTPTRAQIHDAVPGAACFVVPNVASLEEFRRRAHDPATDWTLLTERRRAAVFVPVDTSPQEIRHCLHEEIAQALGPLNDLFRLSDSLFNDDDMHAILTGFDMLMLRVWYAPELAGGPARDSAAAVLPGVLARLNPRGERVAPAPLPPTSRAWIDATKAAIGGRGGAAVRRGQAERALAIAQAEGWRDGRLGFSWYVLGRLSYGDPDAAQAAFVQAYAVYAAEPGPDSIQAATVAMQLAALALRAGDPEAAIALVDRSLPAARRGQDAVLLATLLYVRSAALSEQGRHREAGAARTESLGWARFGLGTAEAAAMGNMRPRRIQGPDTAGAGM